MARVDGRARWRCGDLRFARDGSWRLWWRLGSVLVACGFAAGCGKSGASKPDVTMWLVGSEAQAHTINQLGKAFTKQTGITVRCEAISWGEAHSKYLTSVAGGVQPDIGTMGLTWGSEFGRLGALVDLQQAFPDDVVRIQGKTFPGLWRSIEYQNQVFGIPFDVTVQVLYYRTDLVPKPPETWEELVATLEHLRQEDRRMLIDWGSLSWIGYAPFLWQAGGDFYNAKRTAATLNTPQAARALEFFRDLYTRYQVPKASISLEQGLRTGEFPLGISGNWKTVSLSVGVPELAGKWTIGLLPKGPSGQATAFLGGRILTLFDRSPHKAEAWQFMRYLFQPDVEAQLYEAALSTQDAYLPANLDGWEPLTMEPALKTTLKQQAQDAKGPPPVPGWTESTHLLESAIQRVILHKADPREELAKVDAALTQALRQTASDTP